MRFILQIVDEFVDFVVLLCALILNTLFQSLIILFQCIYIYSCIRFFFLNNNGIRSKYDLFQFFSIISDNFFHRMENFGNFQEYMLLVNIGRNARWANGFVAFLAEVFTSFRGVCETYWKNESRVSVLIFDKCMSARIIF